MIISKHVKNGNEINIIATHTNNGKDIFVKSERETGTRVFDSLKDYFKFVLEHENRIVVLLEENDKQPVPTKIGSAWAELVEYYNNIEEVKNKRSEL